MRVFLKILKHLLGIILGIILGAFLGFLIPWGLAHLYVATGGDETAAGAFGFLIIYTIPLGALICGIIGGIIPLAFTLRKSRRTKADKED